MPIINFLVLVALLFNEVLKINIQAGCVFGEEFLFALNFSFGAGPLIEGMGLFLEEMAGEVLLVGDSILRHFKSVLNLANIVD